MSHNLDMNASRESDGCVVPAKCPNKGCSSTPAEGTEGKRPAKENTGQLAACQIQSSPPPALHSQETVPTVV